MAQPKPATQTEILRARAMIVLGIVAGCYLLLAGRLVYLQAVRHAYFQQQADSYRVSKNILPARRGLLLDRNGDLLATNVPAAAVYADPPAIEDAAGVVQTLAPLLGMDADTLQKKLTPVPGPKINHYVSLKRHVSLSVGEQIKLLNLPGVGVGPDTRRAYPNDELACHVLGFTDRDGVGVEGIEHSQDTQLQGRDGRIVGEIDKEGRFLPGTLRHQQEAQNGHDLVLTLDPQLQRVADTELAAAVQSHHAEKGVAIVVDPNTGEILALSNVPTYNPNQPRPAQKLDKEDALLVTAKWRDGAISNLYEPGSTLKTIMAAAVLQEQGLSMMDKTVYCSPTLQVGKHVIHEAADAMTNNLGSQNLRGVLRVSSNVGAAQFGLGLGSKRLFQYEKAFGFLDNPQSGLPGEQHSFLQDPADFNKWTGSVGWSNIQTANVAFGQGISVTPLQLAMAYSAIANGGTLYKPHIVRAVRDGDKETQIAPEKVRDVVSPEVAAAVRSMLGTVVQSGTGQPAQIAGYTVGGKTGSAQVAGRHGYESGHFVASFVGMYPLSHPKLVILCAVFEPQGIHWGAAVAAPVVHNIAKAAMLQMHIAPDAPLQVDWLDRHKTRPDTDSYVGVLQQEAYPAQ